MEGQITLEPLKENKESKLAIVVHLFYLDIFLEKILPCLKKLPKSCYDLFITTPFDENFVRNICKDIDASITICSYENKGRDVLPFLKIVKQHIFNKYTLFLKIHTKRNFKSKNFQNFWDNIWNDSHYSFLLDKITIDSTCEFLIKNKNIYLGGMPNSRVSFNNHIGDNFPRVFKYLRHLGLEYSPDMVFFSGTMFYGKVEVINPLFFLIDEKWEDEDLQSKDGTMAHVVERLFLVSAKYYIS